MQYMEQLYAHHCRQSVTEYSRTSAHKMRQSIYSTGPVSQANESTLVGASHMAYIFVQMTKTDESILAVFDMC